MQAVNKVDDAQKDSWKEKHGKVKQITVKTPKGDVDFIIGRPTTATLDAVAKYQSQEKPHKVREVLQGSCVLAGDQSALDDVNVRNTVFGKITDMLEQLEVSEKEL